MSMRAEPAGDTDYERAGDGYQHQRRADYRIAERIHSHLGDARTVLNVGAGAGSYEPSDRYVLAVEPSAAMRSRRSRCAVPAIDATAEDLPFDDDSIDAVMAVLTVHQWRDLARGLAEMRRVSRGAVVIVTLDVVESRGFWLHHYLPERLDSERSRFPDIADLRACLGESSAAEPVPIPLDCTDGFVEAFYGRPESLLDPTVRAAQSAWQRLDSSTIEAGLTTLAEDLRSGRWDRTYGHLRTQATLLGPLCLVRLSQ